MYEKPRNTSPEISYIRRIESHDPVFFTYELPDSGVVEMPGSVYLGDAHSEAERQHLADSLQLFNIFDLRSALDNGEGRLFNGLTIDRTVDFMVTQGVPDWERGIGFKGLRQGESLTIGRADPVSSQRFDLRSSDISRKHLTLYAMEQGVAIEDEGSTNGSTYVGYHKSSDTPSER